MAHTWRTFPDEKQAQAYADACWAVILKQAPAAQVPVKAALSKYPADVDQAKAAIEALPAKEAGDVKQELAGVPLKGVDAAGRVVDGAGESTAWAVPTLTASGEWAVPCPPFDTKGGPEPKWPPVVSPVESASQLETGGR